MAQKYKVDPSKIDGFDKMTADEKVAALLGQEIEVDAPLESSEVIKLKNAYNKACEEAGNYRKQLREKQSEAERAEAVGTPHHELVEALIILHQIGNAQLISARRLGR